MNRDVIINPRHACAARVTVLGLCVCVFCLSVKSHLTSGLSNRATNEHTYLVAYERQKFVGICLKQLRSRVMPRNTSEKANMLISRLTRGQLSPLDAQRNVGDRPEIVNDIQPCPKRCLLRLLARVGVRTDSTARAATTRGVANFRDIM